MFQFCKISIFKIQNIYHCELVCIALHWKIKVNTKYFTIYLLMLIYLWTISSRTILFEDMYSTSRCHLPGPASFFLFLFIVHLTVAVFCELLWPSTAMYRCTVCVMKKDSCDQDFKNMSKTGFGVASTPNVVQVLSQYLYDHLINSQNKSREHKS